jgi:hypothetical protein
MKRPFSVTILFYLVLSLIAWSILRLFAIIRWWRIIRVYSNNLWPLYVSVSAVIWMVVGSILFWGLKWKKAWIHNALIGAGACYTVWYWCDRIFVQWPHANWIFALFATILLLVIGIISVKHPNTILFFQRETNDR